MKKIIACIFTGLLICGSMFSGVFNSRFFELKFNGAFDIGNNVFTLDKLLQEEVVIDLKEIADNIPNSGLNLKTSLAPNLEINLNIAKLHIGVEAGLDMYGSITLNKDFFDFIGYGYKVGETKKFVVDASSELFLSLGANVGIKGRKFNLTVTPSVFVPVFVVLTENSGCTFKNSKNGDFDANLSALAKIYSQFRIDDNSKFLGLDFAKLNGTDIDFTDKSTYDATKIVEYLCSVLGFDLAGSVEVPVLPGFKGSVSFRCPVMPGKLNTKTEVTASCPVDFNGGDLVNGDVDFSEFKDAVNYDMQTVSEVYTIHRPLKLDAYLKFAPLGDWLYVKGGLGVGIRAPFSEYATVYPEYMVEGSVSLLSGLFGASVSTEYTNEIFIHKLTMSLGMRATQLDLGLSAESPTLAKSFNFSGLGLYLGFAVGI